MKQMQGPSKDTFHFIWKKNIIQDVCQFMKNVTLHTFPILSLFQQTTRYIPYAIYGDLKLNIY